MTYKAFDDRCSRLIETLRGTVLEVGAGRGANFDALDSSVRWVGLEPNERNRRDLRRNAQAAGHGGAPLAAGCEEIPLEDASVDAVLGTFVLCSVREVDRSLAEIVRVLRPGGSFVFCEHVAAPAGTGKRWLQRVITPITVCLDHGCHWDRSTAQAIERAGLTMTQLDDADVATGSWIPATPCIVGMAVKA
ncbi:MAG TPA: class I SAM-dependent methyltransferase [Microbacteriaceae bacterium]